ncbi:MAG: thiamine phosphate synthase [Pseudomonadota bacterium]
MSAPERAQPQLYLLTPPVIELSEFPDQLAAVLDSTEIACLRLALVTRDEDRLSRAADACRAVAHARDVAIVLDDHTGLAERLGLDGVHLTDAARSVRDARKALGPDAIVGSYCSTSRHDGLTAGEAGADYVAFGPVTAIAGQEAAADDLFAWWSEMIEVPVVAEGGLTLQAIERLAPIADFLALGEEIWSTDAPADTLAALTAPLR